MILGNFASGTVELEFQVSAEKYLRRTYPDQMICFGYVLGISSKVMAWQHTGALSPLAWVYAWNLLVTAFDAVLIAHYSRNQDRTPLSIPGFQGASCNYLRLPEMVVHVRHTERERHVDNQAYAANVRLCPTVETNRGAMSQPANAPVG